MCKSLSLGMSLVVFCAVCSFAADQVSQKNGDRLSGDILKSDGKVLVIKTEFAGEVAIDWQAITEIRSTQTMYVEGKNKQSAAGTLATSGEDVVVTTAAGTMVTFPLSAIGEMRNPSEEAEFEKTQHPGITEGWTGGANVGFALTAGNSQAKNLALAFIADRKALKDHVALYLNSVYATGSTATGAVGTTANSSQSGIRYERNLNSRLFAFVSGDFQTDALQSLDLRSIFSAGLGYHAIKNDRTTLDFLGGANYTRENYSTLQRNVAALTLGEELTNKLGKSTLLAQKLYFFPALNDPGEYRSTFNLGTVTKINKWFGWQNAFGDIYVTNPPAGKKRNDVTLTTGLAVTFAH